jgi:uracil-DNA glycosylase family 4
VYAFTGGKTSKKPLENLYGEMTAKTWAELEERIVACRRCPRLVEWRERMGREKKRAYRGETYWARPVPGFGDRAARVLAVGLAPGAHGSNRTGRMFTGDASGGFLFPALHRAGFASRPESAARDDGLALRGLFITAVCRCAPPDNRPAPEEIRNCLQFLEQEILLLQDLRVFVALGKIAYDTLVRMLPRPDSALRVRFVSDTGMGPGKAPPFAHGALWAVAPRAGSAMPVRVIASYHPSRQNTQTGRLTRSMFDRIWRTARSLIGE